MKIKTKFISGFLILVVIPIAVVGVIGIYLSIITLKDTTIQHLEFSLFTKAETFEKFLSGVRGDVMFLKENSHLKVFLNTSRPEFLRSLEQDFLAFSKSRPQYYQLRYIDENGYEKVRVDSDGFISRAVPSDKLQLKKHRYYFIQSISNPPGIVYVSPMDYNVEWGLMEDPPKKVVRFATSVADDSGAKRGMVIINVYASHLLGLVEKLEKTGGTALLVDSGGRYLFGPPPIKSGVIEDLTDGEKGADADLNNRLEPSLIPMLMSRKQGTVIREGHIISYVPIYTGDVGNDFWVLGIRYPLHIIFDSVTELSIYLLTIGTTALIISISLGLYMSRRLARPILQLNEGVEHIGKRDFKHRVDIKTGDEIEDLADKFNLMASRLEDFNSRMTSWNETLKQEVERRTKELEDSKLELMKERDKLRNLIESAGEGIIIADMNQKITIVNPAAQNILEVSASKLKNKNLFRCQLIRPHALMGLLKKGETHYSTTKEYNGKALDTSVTILRSGEGKISGFMVVFKDITEHQKMLKTKREMERQIFKAEKLASLGVLSAGIAHEIGNPLTAIKLTAQAMAEETDISKSASFYIARLIKEVDRLNTFVKTFSDFAYSHTKKKVEKCQIRDILREVIFWMRKEAENHNVTIHYDDSWGALEDVYVDPSRIQQVIINLVINATHSMSEGGRVDVGVKTVSVPKRGVVVYVSDEGVGIPKKDLSKIFDPFYTTKPEGTGLGLAVAMKIVQEHGGDISVKSKLNHGTTFNVFLPYSVRGEIHAA